MLAASIYKLLKKVTPVGVGRDGVILRPEKRIDKVSGERIGVADDALEVPSERPVDQVIA